MISEDKQIILRVVENYARTGNTDDERFKVTCLPDNKTSTVENIAEGTRSIMLDEYHLDGRTIWAGFSRRSGVIYLSNSR